jgi:hypothetical protein
LNLLGLKVHASTLSNFLERDLPPIVSISAVFCVVYRPVGKPAIFAHELHMRELHAYAFFVIPQNWNLGASMPPDDWVYTILAFHVATYDPPTINFLLPLSNTQTSISKALHKTANQFHPTQL